MNNPSEVREERRANSPNDRAPINDRLVYVMVPEALSTRVEGAVSLLELWSVLWRRKWVVIVTTFIFAALAIPYALSLDEWYRAETLLVSSGEQYSDPLTRQFGGLASLAGVRMGGSSKATEGVATLKSRDFIRSFIEEKNLLRVMFADQWDSTTDTWVEQESEGGAAPDVRDAIKIFSEDVLTVAEDVRSELISLTVAWTDPVVAAEWANALVARVNEKLRERTLAEANKNITFLNSELASTNVVTLQQSLSRLLESELQKMMLARGNDEFVFRVIDKADVPKRRFKPNRSLIVVTAIFLGGLLSTMGVLMFHTLGLAGRKLKSGVE